MPGVGSTVSKQAVMEKVLISACLLGKKVRYKGYA
jgi:hypothetical protein